MLNVLKRVFKFTTIKKNFQNCLIIPLYLIFIISFFIYKYLLIIIKTDINISFDIKTDININFDVKTDININFDIKIDIKIHDLFNKNTIVLTIF